MSKMGDSPKRCKSILKPSSSFDKHDTSAKRNRNAKWDEMNILETYHPANKDYGHMKVDEPKTPYNFDSVDDEVDSGNKKLDHELLHAKLVGVASSSRKTRDGRATSEEESDDDEKHLDEAEKLRRKEFTNRRKMHYNEFKAAQVAKMLMEEDADDDEEEESNKGDLV